MEIINLQDGFVTYLNMDKSIRVGLYSYLIWSKLFKLMVLATGAVTPAVSAFGALPLCGTFTGATWECRLYFNRRSL